MVVRTVDIDFEFLNYIDTPPVAGKELYSRACSADAITINSWKDIWIANAKANKEKYGSFSENSIGQLYGKFEHKPAICIGSGPSLRLNVELLKDTYNIPKISCLHNYHYLEDNGVDVEFYVSLDAGEITTSELSKGGKKTPEEYHESTKNKTLLAYIGTSPRLLEKWQGKVLFFTCPTPDKDTTDAITAIEPFFTYVSSGGNVLGGCVYIAKAIFGCNPICFVGADFSFSYTKQFHPWFDENYKNVGTAMRANDVYGNKVLTWQSYFNFKCFFDWVAQTIPGLYINCTEGGILGSFPEGNIRSIIQMDLKSFLIMYSLHLEIKDQCENPSVPNFKILY